MREKEIFRRIYLCEFIELLSEEGILQLGGQQ